MFGIGKKNVADATIRINVDKKQANKDLSALKKTIGTVISAVVIKETARYSLELANLGAQADSVNKNFANWAKRGNVTTEQMMQRLRKATLGMVSDLELQQRSMQAMISGVNFEDIITSMEFVTKYAQATGTDVSQKMQTTMTGLARGSAQFLDDIGIQVMGSKDVVKDAVAQMKEKMDQFTLSEEDAAVKSRQLQIEMENLKVSIGQKLQPAFIGLLKVIDETIKGWEQLLGFGKEKEENASAIIKETMLLRDLRLEQEQIRDTQLALKSMGGSLFSPESLEQAENNIATINEQLKELNKEAQGLSSVGPAKIDVKVTKAAKDTSKDDEKRKREREKKAKEEQEFWLGFEEEQLRLRKEANERSIELIKEKNERIQAENDEHRRVELEKEKEVEKQKQYLKDQALANASIINNSLAMMSDARTQRQIENLEELSLSEEEFEKRKAEILEEGEEKRKAFARIQQGIAIGEAIINALKAGTGAAADTPGGAITRGLAMGASIAAGMVQVAAIQKQSFATGRIGDTSRSRQKDDVLSLLGQGETVISAPQTSQHEDTLRAIQDNTANTARGMSMSGGGSIINNFYTVTTEQMLQSQTTINRRNRTGIVT